MEPRLAGAPRELAAEVRACLERVSGRVRPGWTVAETLAGAAVEAFDRVLAGGRQGREGAVLLLAADATLTYAFEAAAELGEDLAGLAERVGVRGLLGRRLEELASGGGPAEGRWG